MAAAATAASSAVRISAVGAHRFSSRSLLSLRSFAPKQHRPLASFSKRGIQTCTSLYRTADVITKEDGQPETLDYRVFFLDSAGKKVSPWHDIPLKLGDGVFNFVVEIPKESSAKMEVATDEPYTPIKQDTKKGKLRYYPYNINWNYGLLPQTWEDPSFANAEVEGAFGDNDPVDVVEIGGASARIGDVLKVKPLGALAMIDEGELDWKIVAISLDDPKASLVNDVDDVEKHFPGTLTAIRDWFRDYKIPDGKPANKFGLGNKAANKMQLPAAEATTEKASGKAQTVEAAQADDRARLKTMTKKRERRSKNPRNSETSSRNSEDPYQILKYPLTTEAALKELEVHNTLVFVVDKRADKKKIRGAVEKLYDIKTKKVNTSMRPDGSKRAFVMCETNVVKTIGLL